MEDGEDVTGYLMSKPNKDKKRDLDISIEYRLETDDQSRITDGGLEFKM